VDKGGGGVGMRAGAGAGTGVGAGAGGGGAVVGVSEGEIGVTCGKDWTVLRDTPPTQYSLSEHWLQYPESPHT